MKRTYSTSLAIVLLTLATACAGFRAPEIELESVELGSLGITGGTMLVNVAVTNPNSFGARADELRYELFVREPGDASEDGWRRLAAGTYEEELVVRAGERRVVQVPVAFRFADLGSAGASALRTGRVDYRATGTARVRAAGVTRDVPFRKTGSVMILGAR